MEKKQEWVCANPDCSLKIFLADQNQTGDLAPICLCGSKMKRPYTSPQLTRLMDDEMGSLSKLFPLTRTS